MASLTPVIQVDRERCVNCHACIAVCPVKYCNDGSGDHIALNSDLCIGCGSCLAACTHGARGPIDDGQAFFRDVGHHQFVAVAAPAVASNFPDHYLRLNGYLKSLGVEAVFDVSFGAELTVKSYLKHIEKSHPRAVIAQPCPAIVTYLEVYRPELLPYLAPADSPMVHTIKMIREFYPEFRDHRVVVLSPCVAKRREFDELGLGPSVYNVTYQSLWDELKKNRVELASFPEVDYSGPRAERAVLFSSPGGLQRTLEREAPEAAQATRKIEGPRIIYPYLDHLRESIHRGQNPLVIDCLNCEMGCNGGPGTLNQQKSPDEVEHRIEARSQEARDHWAPQGGWSRGRTRKALDNTIAHHWRPGLYDRGYLDHSANLALRVPSSTERQAVFQSMAKYRPEDLFNCNSCGYGSCEKMALAIFNGLNRPENCHHFNLEQVNVETQKVRAEQEKLSQIITANGVITGAIETIVGRMVASNRAIGEKAAQLSALADQEQERNRGIVEKLEGLAEGVSALDGVVKAILDLARKSNILALNATIEASRAGSQGKAFAVVANEVKRMSVQTREEAQKIQPFAEELKAMMGQFIAQINQSFQGFGDQTTLIRDVSAVAAEIGLIAGELEAKAAQLSRE